MLDLSQFSQENLNKIQKVLRIVLDEFELHGINRLVGTAIPTERFEREGFSRRDVIAILNRINDGINEEGQVIRLVEEVLDSNRLGFSPPKTEVEIKEFIAQKREESERYIHFFVANLEGLKAIKQDVDEKINGSQRFQSKPVALTPTSPFHQPTMREIMKDAEEANRELHRQSFEKQLHRESLKQQRILATKEDKYVHALNTIIEWAEYYGDGKGVPLDYYYFNFEDRMDDSKMLERFLDKLKDARCFKSWGRTNYAGGTRFGFAEVSLKKLNEYKKERTEAAGAKTTPPQGKRAKKIRTKYENGVLQFQGREINFNGKPNQKDLLATLFKDPEKNWYYDEIQEDWDDQWEDVKATNPLAKEYWRKFYSAGNDINQAVAIETQVKDFLVKDTKQIQINGKYI